MGDRWQARAILVLALLLLSGCSGGKGSESGGNALNIGGAASTLDNTSQDTEITRAVQNKIDGNPELKSAGIKARAGGGQVELTGVVPQEALRVKAEDLAFEALAQYKDTNAAVLNSITLAEDGGEN